jgi:hypothetical protein
LFDRETIVRATNRGWLSAGMNIQPLLPNCAIPSRSRLRSRVPDATDVAIATVAGADALLSWDRLHIVGLARVQGYNRVNQRLGYQELTIATPTHYRAAQTQTP